MLSRFYQALNEYYYPPAGDEILTEIENNKLPYSTESLATHLKNKTYRQALIKRLEHSSLQELIAIESALYKFPADTEIISIINERINLIIVDFSYPISPNILLHLFQNQLYYSNLQKRLNAATIAQLRQCEDQLSKISLYSHKAEFMALSCRDSIKQCMERIIQPHLQTIQTHFALCEFIYNGNIRKFFPKITSDTVLDDTLTASLLKLMQDQPNKLKKLLNIVLTNTRKDNFQIGSRLFKEMKNIPSPEPLKIIAKEINYAKDFYLKVPYYGHDVTFFEKTFTGQYKAHDKFSTSLFRILLELFLYRRIQDNIGSFCDYQKYNTIQRSFSAYSNRLCQHWNYINIIFYNIIIAIESEHNRLISDAGSLLKKNGYDKARVLYSAINDIAKQVHNFVCSKNQTRLKLHENITQTLKKYARSYTLEAKRNPAASFFRHLVGVLLAIPTALLFICERYRNWHINCFFHTKSNGVINKTLAYLEKTHSQINNSGLNNFSR